MSDNLIESFLKYEEQRKAQKNPNEFQSVKILQERNNGGTPVSANPLNSIASLIGSTARNIVGRLSSSDKAIDKDDDDGEEQQRMRDAAMGFANTYTIPLTPTANTSDPVGTGDDSAPAAANSASLTLGTPIVADIATPAANSTASADSKQIIPARGLLPMGWGPRSSLGNQDRHLRWQFRGYSDPSPRGFGRDTPSTATPGDGEGSMDAASAPAQRTSSVARAEDEAGAPPKPELASVGTRTTNLRVGSRGDDVKSAQRALGISDDGIYGNQTRQAVMDFQRKHGLQVDGIIGDQTMSALRRAGAGLSVRGSGAATNESVQFSEAELAHFKSILEAMPVAPTAEGHGPNPTPKNKAEGGKGRGSLSEKMDPVGEEDNDVNNDGEENTDADEYLKKRRAAIAAANMKKKK